MDATPEYVNHMAEANCALLALNTLISKHDRNADSTVSHAALVYQKLCLIQDLGKLSAKESAALQTVIDRLRIRLWSLAKVI